MFQEHCQPLCNRSSPALCFFTGARPLALAAASLCFSFTLNSLIIIPARIFQLNKQLLHQT
jgi:hypothetical protein